MEPYAGTLMTKWYRQRGYVSLMRSLWHTWRRMILSRRIYSSTFGKDQRLCSSSGRPFSQTSFRRSGTLPNNNQESSVNSGRPAESCARKINTIYLIVDTTRIWMKTPTASTVKLRARYQRRPSWNLGIMRVRSMDADRDVTGCNRKALTRCQDNYEEQPIPWWSCLPAPPRRYCHGVAN